MTVQQLLDLLSQHPLYTIIYFVALPLVCIVLRMVHGAYRGGSSPWKYIYSVLIYLSCIPGIFSLFISLYSVFFIRANLLAVNVLAYLLPIASMVLALFIIRKSVSFDDIPGFRRIFGLFSLVALTFLALFVLDRLRILLLFHSPILLFVGLWIGIFFLLKYSARLLFGRLKKK